MALARVEQLNLGLSAGAVAASYALATPHFATSLAAGAALEAINLGAIHRAAKRLFDGKMMTNGWVGMLSMRLILLAFAIYFAMRMGAHPVALVIGLSITMPATLIDAWMSRPPIIDPAELPTFLEEFDEEDHFYSDHEDRTSERIVPTGHLLTSRPFDLDDRNDLDDLEEKLEENVAGGATSTQSSDPKKPSDPAR
jgi:hypothetical protein